MPLDIRPGVYELSHLSDGRRAFYTVGRDGDRSPLRYLGAAERETDLILEMGQALGVALAWPQLTLLSPHGASAA